MEKENMVDPVEPLNEENASKGTRYELQQAILSLIHRMRELGPLE